MDTRGRESGEGNCLTLAPGSDRIPVELLQILTQYAICREPAGNQVKVLKKRKLPLVRQIRIRKVTYLMTIVNTAV